MTAVIYVSGDADERRAVCSGLRDVDDEFDVRGVAPGGADYGTADCVVFDARSPTTASDVADLRSAGYDGPVLLFGPAPYDELDRTAPTGVTDVVRQTGSGSQYVVLGDRVRRAVDGAETGTGTGTGTASTGDRDDRTTRAEILTRLHGATRDLIRASGTDEIAEITVETARSVLDLDIGVVGAYDGDDDLLRPVAATDAAERAVPHLVDRTYGRGSTVLELFHAGETRLFTDAGEHLDEVTDELAAAIVLPLGRHGMLAVGSADHSDVSAEEYDLARLLAANAETALDRASREASLREDRDRIAALFQNASDAIVEVEYVDGDPIVRGVNPAFESVFGYAEADIVGTNVDDVIVPPARREEAESYNEEAVHGEGIEREVRRETLSGTRDFLLRAVPLDPGGKQNHGYGIYTDITERKRHERTLNSLHETTRQLMRAEHPDVVADIAIDAVASILGYPVNGLRLYDEDRDVLELVAAPDRTFDVLGDRPRYERDDGIVWDAYERGETAVYDDLSTVADGYDRSGIASGMYVPLGRHGVLSFGSCQRAAFSESDKRLAQLLAANVQVALDRAERTQLLRDRESELERQNERLDEFASVVSHDLRNPLSVARGYLDLARETCDAPEADDHFDRVSRAHDRMARLISDLLSLARQGQTVGDTEPVSVADLAEQSWGVIDTASAALDVADPPVVEADPKRLSSLLENLFRNSVEHGSTSSQTRSDDSVEHGSTSSRAEPDDAVEHGGETVSVRVGALGDGTAGGPSGFFVEDDGPGVPPEDRDKVFDRGYTTGDDGTGFGLGIVRGIADAHGWDVTLVESDEGGARFEVRVDG
jgi:PAS domain S-box-containing protein